MKKKILYSVFIPIGTYLLTFIILSLLGGKEEIRIKEKGGKFDIVIEIEAPMGFVVNKKATFLTTVYYPFYSLEKNIEEAFWREFRLASEELN